MQCAARSASHSRAGKVSALKAHRFHVQLASFIGNGSIRVEKINERSFSACDVSVSERRIPSVAPKRIMCTKEHVSSAFEVCLNEIQRGG